MLIIKAGSTFPAAKQRFGDFEDWIVDGSGLQRAECAIVDMASNEELPDVGTLSGVIITGAHAMVTDQEPWMRNLSGWMPDVLNHNIPLLGICFGHQLLAQAMGGEVDYHPGGREIGSVQITLTTEGKQDRLLGSLPALFMAHTTHAQTVITLPVNAHVLAENSFEAHHAYRVGKNAWGVQFHPEFSAEIMHEYVSEQSASLINGGQDFKAIQAAICSTGHANRLLKRFMEIVQENGN